MLIMCLWNKSRASEYGSCCHLSILSRKQGRCWMDWDCVCLTKAFTGPCDADDQTPQYQG